MKITKRQLLRIIKEEKTSLLAESYPSTNADRSIGLYADITDLNALNDSILNIYRQVDDEAQEDGHDRQEAADLSRNAVIEAVAQAFNEAGITSARDALRRILT